MVGWVAQPGLRQAGRWHVAARTIGNDHSTLIGLLIDWWTSMDPEHHWALEGGPGNGLPEGGGRGQRDALFCRGLAPIGVLEVEGYRYAIEKIGSFFEAHYPELKPLEFRLLLLYNYEPKGRGEQRHLPPAATKETLRKVSDVSAEHPAKSILVIALNKRYARQSEGIRARSEYYFAEPVKIDGRLYVSGECIGRH